MNFLDFWAWGYLKWKVFSYPQPTTTAQLKARINMKIDALDPAMNCRACLISFKKRCQQGIQAKGGNIYTIRSNQTKD